MNALSEGYIKIEELGSYRNQFKESRKFVKYLDKHPNHFKNLDEQKIEEKEKNNMVFKRELERRDFLNFDGSMMR